MRSFLGAPLKAHDGLNAHRFSPSLTSSTTSDGSFTFVDSISSRADSVDSVSTHSNLLVPCSPTLSHAFTRTEANQEPDLSSVVRKHEMQRLFRAADFPHLNTAAIFETLASAGTGMGASMERAIVIVKDNKENAEKAGTTEPRRNYTKRNQNNRISQAIMPTCLSSNLNPRHCNLCNASYQNSQTYKTIDNSTSASAADHHGPSPALAHVSPELIGLRSRWSVSSLQHFARPRPKSQHQHQPEFEPEPELEPGFEFEPRPRPRPSNSATASIRRSRRTKSLSRLFQFPELRNALSPTSSPVPHLPNMADLIPRFQPTSMSLSIAIAPEPAPAAAPAQAAPKKGSLSRLLSKGLSFTKKKESKVGELKTANTNSGSGSGSGNKQNTHRHSPSRKPVNSLPLLSLNDENSGAWKDPLLEFITPADTPVADPHATLVMDEEVPELQTDSDCKTSACGSPSSSVDTATTTSPSGGDLWGTPKVVNGNSSPGVGGANLVLPTKNPLRLLKETDPELVRIETQHESNYRKVKALRKELTEGRLYRKQVAEQNEIEKQRRQQQKIDGDIFRGPLQQAQLEKEKRQQQHVENEIEIEKREKETTKTTTRRTDAEIELDLQLAEKKHHETGLLLSRANKRRRQSDFWVRSAHVN